MDLKKAREIRKKKAMQAVAAAASRLGGKRSKSHRDVHSDVAWVSRRELDPECAYFPLSHWGASMKGAREENYLFTLRLAFDQAVTTDGSGTYAAVVSNSPVQAQNWANYAAVFDECRVLAFQVRYEPFWTVNCTFAPFASVVDRSDSTALTGYGLAERYASHRKVMGKAAWKQTVNMADVSDAAFASTASPAANCWIKSYTAGNTASFTMGRLNVVLLVQFRGVGIN